MFFENQNEKPQRVRLGRAVRIGNTKPISEQLKKIGGRFNSRLSCGAGWIFSKRKESELRTLLAL